jgi:Zn-dependent protease with chaperone function
VHHRLCTIAVNDQRGKGSAMRFMFAVQFVVLQMFMIDCATGQQYYSFEEACRKAGWTTGACAPKSPKASECVSIVGNAFHAERFPQQPCIPVTLAPVVDSEIVVEMIGLQNIPKLNELKVTVGRSVGFKNAVALFHNGSRMVIYDPEWARSDDPQSYLVLAHEMGHHFCGHTIANANSEPQQTELEADRFSGAAIKRFETYHNKAFLAQALVAAAQLYSIAGSRSHPPRAERVAAVTLGYNDGSACGNLAPGISGWTNQNR